MEKVWFCNFSVERHSYKVVAPDAPSQLFFFCITVDLESILLSSVSGQFTGAFRRSKPAQERPKRTQEHPRNSSLLSSTPQEPSRLISYRPNSSAHQPPPKPPPSLQSTTRTNPNLPRNFLEGGSPAGAPPACHVEHRYRVRRGGSARSHGDDGTPCSAHAPHAPPARQPLRPRALY